MSSVSPAASNISAITPLTWGAAMLVPLLIVNPSRNRPPSVGTDERAARMDTPGAAIAGSARPSRVGPALLNPPMA